MHKAKLVTYAAINQWDLKTCKWHCQFDPSYSGLQDRKGLDCKGQVWACICATAPRKCYHAYNWHLSGILHNLEWNLAWALDLFHIYIIKERIGFLICTLDLKHCKMLKAKILRLVRNLQMALPCLSSIHLDPGPHGLGLHGSGLGTHLCHCTSQTLPCLQFTSVKHSTQPCIESGMGTNPWLHLNKYNFQNMI